MFINLFHNKAVGFKFFDTFIKYAFITYTDNKIIVNETQLFNINCKTALHRLQHLLTKYPSCYLLDSQEALLNQNSPNIPNPKDRNLVVKNKVENLTGGKSVKIGFQDFVGKKSASLVAVQELFLTNQLKKLSCLGIKPEKTIFTFNALITLNQFFTSNIQEKIVLCFNLEKVECIFLIQKKLVNFLSFNLSNLNNNQIEIKILKELYAFFKNKPIPTLEFHGAHPFLESIILNIEKKTGAVTQPVSYGTFEDSFPHYLHEIGAALSILKKTDEGIQKNNLTALYKIYNKAVYANLLMIIGTFLLSVLFWNHKLSSVESINKRYFYESLSKLSSKEKPYSSDQIPALKELLLKRKKQTPPFLFQPKILMVSDAFAWLSEISSNLEFNDQTPPLTIESFKYSIVSSPTIKNPKTPYKIKVSFSFITPSSQTARLIHDKVFKSNSIVDKTKQIEWNYKNNNYQVSFFLKNQPTKKVKND